MPSTKLQGTEPQQCPTNADLGELAFQNKDSVEFTGGKGGLSSLDLTAIAASKNVSAVDIFVYDTSKDSDGGQWRNRCQNTSWYNEELNTSIRGSRREFPSVAVIVATSSNFTIYDGDDPSLPMWMVMNGGVPTVLYTTLTSLSATNGILCVGTNPNSSNYYDGGVKVISFINDFMRSYSYGYSVMRYAYNIAQRNTSWSGQTNPHQYGDSSGVLLNPNVNDVAMTVLPNAPIDAATGLPIPTIAVATSGGVSVIHNTGTIYNITDSNAVWNYFKTVNFTQDYKLIINGSYQLSDNNIIHVCDIPYASYNLNTVNAQITQLNSRYYHADTSIPNIRNGSRSLAFTASTGINAFAVGTGALNLIAERPETQSGITSASMVDYITTTFNTGWMPGNIKGAWLSDTTQETAVGAELVTNGTFDSNLSGWTSTGATISQSAGQATIVGTSAADTSGMYQVISGLQIGATYILSGNLVSSSGSNRYLYLSSAGNPRDQSLAGAGNASWVVGTTTTVQWVATTSTVSVFIGTYGTQTIVADNISLRRADADRSVNSKGLQVYGSITKTPVATGADLVAYSGFSASNYLEQPYNSALDFGTGDFCISVWLTHPNTFSGHSHVIARINPEIGNEFTIQYNESVQNLVFRCGGSEFANIGSLSTNIWTHIVYTRRGGVLYGYMNGSLKSSSTFAANISSQNPLRVGYRSSLYAGIWTGSLTLLRISATAPSDDQIKKMYNDEKVLFQDNAKATLYGASDAVTALAYDQDTKLLHVGTSSGRSVFQGLRRVDNTTTAVSTSISAANGLVAEN